MDDKNKNLVLILLVLALFTGMAVEVSEGSNVLLLELSCSLLLYFC